MPKYLVYSIIFVVISCSKPDPESYIKHINGYWEIEKVITADGVEIHYNFNQSIDFFEIKDSLGIRKKLQPQLSGSFITTKSNEIFRLEIENDSLRLYYKTPLDQWRETVVSAKEKQIILKNEAGNLYFYKPYKKMEL